MPKPKKRNWKTISSRVIHQNPWYQLRHDKVVRPDGRGGDYYYLAGVNSVTIIAVDRQKRILLVGQNRYPISKRYSWELVGGGVPSHKNPLAVARQELQEEGGLAAKKWIPLGSFFPYNGAVADQSFCFLAQDLYAVDGQPEATENITRRWVSSGQIIKMIKQGTIHDGMALAALHKYFLQVGRYK